MQQELIRVHRVAKMLDVSVKRIYQMVQEGHLESVRLGPRALRITKNSIQEFVEKGKAGNRRELGLPENLPADIPAQNSTSRRTVLQHPAPQRIRNRHHL